MGVSGSRSNGVTPEEPAPAERVIHVQALARVEGEGALHIRWGREGLERVELRIYEPPRFFERFLRGRHLTEVPDIVARICGICPVAYQMSACHALEKATGTVVTDGIRRLRRLLYCGEWIESHALHIHLLHAPDFLGYPGAIEMAKDHAEIVERGLRIKKIGNRLLEVLGGRAIHPINVAVGGFHRAPDPEALHALLPDLQAGFEASCDVARWAATLDFPPFESVPLMVSLRHPGEYPMNEGRVVTADGQSLEVDNFLDHFEGRQVPHSTALHAVRKADGANYLVGPLARLNLAREQLPPGARSLLDELPLAWPCRNNFQSIIARAVEMAAAFEEAVAIVRDYDRPIEPPRVPLGKRAGIGSHATEAPRGLLFHRYEVDSAGRIVRATIIPPTSQNQAAIEADLRRIAADVIALPLDEATHRCEQMIRNYDPCISCATHFLKLHVERVDTPPSA